ncbi:MAG: sigma-54 dependent transcriptional regulator [Bacteroidales bacterium]|nr:sigma-54 dependent transcriptional regulator [Bacteroidales bacterium]
MILIVDDDRGVRASLNLLFKKNGYEVALAADAAEAMAVVRSGEPLQLVMLDMNFSRATTGEEGLTMLKQIKLFMPQVPVILMTAWGSIPLAVEGIQAGAFDFITKPWDNQLLLQRVKTAIDLREDAAVSQATQEDFDRSLIIGKSEGLMRVLDTIKRIARTDASVLIMGENGTGKELIAETIHRNSRRAKKPFVKVNLGGISQSLFESEMFGHKKGAFTGAVADRQGRFALADKGTIFLDEIGDLDLSCQVKLLRVLQEHTFEVLGESRPTRVDMRVVCATNADLPAMVREKTFREDLFYRINLITVTLPPLRERREDIPLLVKHFAGKIAKDIGAEQKITQRAMEFLSRLPYPGNIRELKNLVERTMLVGNTSGMLDREDFEAQYQPQAPKTDLSTGGYTLDEIERHTIEQALEKYDGNLTRVATELGITRQSLYRRMEKYGLMK